MMIGSLLQSTAYTRAHLIVARIVSGFGLGAVNSTVPVFQAEFAPKATRGLCMFNLAGFPLLQSVQFLPSADMSLLRRLHATVHPQLRYCLRVLD